MNVQRVGLLVASAALLAGESVSGPARARAAAPSWHQDVLPIVQQRCLGCHVAGGIAPFSLESAKDAIPRAAAIAAAVETGRMPPWKANDACRPLRDSRRLDDAEKAAILGWVAGGSAEGDPPATPPAPPPIKALEWVDINLKMRAPYTPSMTRADDYRCFVLDPGLPGERDLIGFDIVPGQRAMVHHVLLYGVNRAEALALDAREPGEGYTCFGGPGGGSSTVYGAWVPGSAATRYPEGTGVTMETDRVVVMQIHYNTAHAGHSPSGTSDLTTVQFQLSPSKVEKPATIFPLADLAFTIPPRTNGVSTSVTVPLPLGITVHGAGPHMHTRGRSIRVTARDGGTESSEECLVDVPSWDFNWQQLYQFVEARTFRPGTRFTLTCSWDNPTDKLVRWGEGTDDEMCLNYLYFTR